MSARNSRAAKAVRRSTRMQRTAPGAVPADERVRIADALHAAVCTVTGTDGFRLCNLYAAAASLVLAEVTGHRWGLHAGQAYVGTGVDKDSPLGEICYAWTGPGGSDVHAWAVRLDGAELADFTLRHWERMVAMSGGGWEREHLPAFYWGPRSGASAIGGPIRMSFNPDRATTQMVSATVSEMRATAENVATVALASLGVISAETANRALVGAVLLEPRP